MNIEQAVELLEWLGYERDGDRWCNFKVDPSYTFAIHNIREFALTELSANKEVMERVVKWLNTNGFKVEFPGNKNSDNRYESGANLYDLADPNGGYAPYFKPDLIAKALKAGIGKQIMGEG